MSSHMQKCESLFVGFPNIFATICCYFHFCLIIILYSCVKMLHDKLMGPLHSYIFMPHKRISGSQSNRKF